MPFRGAAGRMRRLARVAFAGGAVLLLFGIGLYPATGHPEFATRGFATGGPGGGGGRMNVTVNATDGPPYFLPGNVTAIAGDQVEFILHNTGSYDRSFTITTVANYTIPVRDSPQALSAFFTANGSWANVSLPAHSTAFTNVTFPGSDAGSFFEFVSLVPFQFQAGAFGFVHVGYSTSAGSYQLSVQATDSLQFVPDTLVIQNVTTFPITVSVEIMNAGSVQHTFWIEGQDNNSLSPSNFSTYFTAHAPLASVNIPTTPGQPVWANFTLTGKGAFEFICTVPGHFRLPTGMYGWVYVGWAPSPPPAPPSSELVGVVFLAGAGGLLVLGVFLTAVASLVGRFPRRSLPPGHP